MAVISGIMVAFTLPPSKVHSDLKAKVQAIDHWGVVFSSSALLLLLIPISGGGIYFDWNSPMVISMLTLGGICMVLFILVEWKFAAMPMLPLHLFKNPAVFAIFVQNLLFGIVYYSHLYYLPTYYQNVGQYSPLLSAALTIPFVAGQSTSSILSGQYISRTKRYGETIWSGYALWTLGAGLVLLFSRTTPRWQIVIFLLIEGAGVGNVFQPTIIAVQAHSLKRNRAVVISIINFLRSLGGSLGLAISSSIFSNSLKKSLSAATSLPEDVKAGILAAILRVLDLSNISSVEKEEVLNSYMHASTSVFLIWAPIMGACLLLCFLVKGKGLTRPEEKQQVEDTPETSGSSLAGVSGVSDVEIQAQTPSKKE